MRNLSLDAEAISPRATFALQNCRPHSRRQAAAIWRWLRTRVRSPGSRGRGASSQAKPGTRAALPSAPASLRYS